MDDTRLRELMREYFPPSYEFEARDFASAVARDQQERDAQIAADFETDMECANDCGEKIAVAIRATPETPQ